MEVLELYDGESRSKVWWKVVRRHTIVIAALSPAFVFFALAALDAAPSGIGVSGLVTFWLVVSLVFWPLLLGFSILAPRLAFSLYYWNGWLMLILLVPALLASFIAGQIHGTNSVMPFAVFATVYAIGVGFKTAILYRRFTMAASEKGKQRLPT